MTDAELEAMLARSQMVVDRPEVEAEVNAFVARAARQDIPRLVAEVRRLRAKKPAPKPRRKAGAKS